MAAPHSDALVLFGATGDLAYKQSFPTLQGFAARPSGTEAICKIYAESFRGEAHLERIVEEARAMVDDALGVKGNWATA